MNNSVQLPEDPDDAQVVIDKMVSNIFRTESALRRQAHEAEVKIKGFYCDWVLTSLNLKK